MIYLINKAVKREMYNVPVDITNWVVGWQIRYCFAWGEI